jgi:two-component system chemotaxis response regulator CheB
MDLKMPVMSGLEAIQQIMEDNPIPIIVVSSLEVSVVVKALGIGAMDFVAVAQDIDAIAKDLLEKIKIASRVKPMRRMKLRPAVIQKKFEARTKCKLVTIGVSTGGPQALLVVLSKLPKQLPAAVAIVQHMSKGFIDGLAEWLSSQCELKIKIAAAGDALVPSTVFFAPDDYNLKIDQDHRIVLSEDVGKLSLHVPSIDSMMISAAGSFGGETVGVIMTGMGTDGVEGIKAIKRAGGKTIAQDEKSSVVFGMNKASIDSGCVDRVVPLENIAEEIINSI